MYYIMVFLTCLHIVSESMAQNPKLLESLAKAKAVFKMLSSLGVKTLMYESMTIVSLSVGLCISANNWLCEALCIFCKEKECWASSWRLVLSVHRTSSTTPSVIMALILTYSRQHPDKKRNAGLWHKLFCWDVQIFWVSMWVKSQVQKVSSGWIRQVWRARGATAVKMWIWNRSRTGVVSCFASPGVYCQNRTRHWYHIRQQE